MFSQSIKNKQILGLKNKQRNMSVHNETNIEYKQNNRTPAQIKMRSVYICLSTKIQCDE